MRRRSLTFSKKKKPDNALHLSQHSLLSHSSIFFWFVLQSWRSDPSCAKHTKHTPLRASASLCASCLQSTETTLRFVAVFNTPNYISHHANFLFSSWFLGYKQHTHTHTHTHTHSLTHSLTHSYTASQIILPHTHTHTTYTHITLLPFTTGNGARHEDQLLPALCRPDSQAH